MACGVAKIILKFLSSKIHVLQQSFKGCMGYSKVDRQENILFFINSRVSKTMVQFFQTSDALVNVKKIPVRRVSSIVSRMVHYPAAILVLIIRFMVSSVYNKNASLARLTKFVPSTDPHHPTPQQCPAKPGVAAPWTGAAAAGPNLLQRWECEGYENFQAMHRKHSPYYSNLSDLHLQEMCLCLCQSREPVGVRFVHTYKYM